MPQPPQPPNQPPSGGFGPPPPEPQEPEHPQEPGRDGFGPRRRPPTPPTPPTTPPAAPESPSSPPSRGHTPPQIWDTGALPASPPPPPPGAPPAPDPPNPYAQNPYAQNPYAADPYARRPEYGGPYTPPPGGPPGTPPPTGGGRAPKRKAVIIGAAVAVLLAAGGGVYAAVGGDDGGKDPTASPTKTTPGHPRTQDPTPEPTTGDGDSTGGRGSGESDPNDQRRAGEAKVLYQKPAPEVSKSNLEVPGFWAMKGYVVKAVENKITAYKDEGGSKWTLSLRKAVCAAPTSTTDGKVVVAYEGHGRDSCSQLALIDLNKGVKLWDHPAPESDAMGGGYTNVGMAQSGNLVGMAWFGGSAVIKVSDGKEVSPEKPSAGCSIDGYAGGKVLLRAYSCTNGTAKLQQLTAGGSIKWTYTIRKGLKVSNIFSSSPAVVALIDQDRSSGGILALSDKGKERSTLALGKQSYQPECGTDIFGTNMGNCEGVAVSADTFYLPTEMTQDHGLGSTSEIHAFDLTTGKRKWAVKVAERLLLPLNMDGKNLISYERPSYTAPGQIVRIGPDGGKPKTLLRLPRATQKAERAFYSATHTYRDGNFYIATNRITGTGTTTENLLMAFGH
ncbi:PQQ-like beta-propeller repeat protein [Streptomyces rugosispiralis]|uniref:PQQ-like beta-propeller repeat protein n=1 Tax=Streptomyces rugosispiralis TaxID=2967341 RepID=A0ABT1VB32_9ACTN|nr:PQQ-like beta-propeller repeat protein [Streptomyces rugosispiralis]MCQ8194607.1 PQQ-like beta-propeller repeat protein [Streptomyces rugosispiralis]